MTDESYRGRYHWKDYDCLELVSDTDDFFLVLLWKLVDSRRRPAGFDRVRHRPQGFALQEWGIDQSGDSSFAGISLHPFRLEIQSAPVVMLPRHPLQGLKQRDRSSNDPNAFNVSKLCGIARQISFQWCCCLQMA
ncbi:hypothetical protein MTO96_007339 [Rhipicephalus appendiculatus]